jgi:DNA repair exonuclease SbcCD nuclease subunit
MGKIIICADIHCGVPGKLKDCIWAINIINKYALKNKIENVLVLGDLFHDRTSLGIDVINAVFDQFKIMKESGIKWMAFSGNHDLFYKNRWDCNSIHSFKDIIDLEESIGIRIIQNQRFWILPFVHYENVYMEKMLEIEKKADKNDILLTHIGVLGATLNECFLLKNWSQVTFDNTKFKRVYAGHFHCYQEIDKVTYPGSPIPFRFDEGMSDHGFLVYDLNTNTHEFIKIFDIYTEFDTYKPPDYMTIIDKVLLKNTGWLKGNNIKIALSKEYTSNEMDKIRNFAIKHGALSVGFKMEQKIIEESKITYQEQKLGTPRALFEEYLKKDDHKLIQKTLLDLHDIIEKEAEERILIEDDAQTQD